MAAPQNSRVVKRHLRYAWFEYEDPRDGIAFDRGFSSGEIGGRNLLHDLPPHSSDPRRKVSANLPGLEIGWLRSADNPNEQGLVARPSDAQNAFLVQWALNPGVANGQLTFGAAQEQADVVIFSGHGAGGTVMGSASGSFVQIDLARGFAQHASTPTSGRVKYLILPACKLAAFDCVRYWLPILRKQKPFHGVLGYDGPYPGDAIGAVAIRNFLRAIRTNPAVPILNAWASGNSGLPWGAIQLADSRQDSIQRWVTDGLPEPNPSAAIRHYNRTTLATGGRVFEQFGSVYSIRFAMADGTEIQMSNNDASSPTIGLFPARPGSLIIRALPTGMTFEPGQTFRVIFYRYRPEHPEMDLDKLLQFDSTLFSAGPDNHPTIRKVVDANPKKQGGPNGRVDGIDVQVHAQTREVRLPFAVRSASDIAYYSIDGLNAASRGRFALLMVPPGVSNTSFDSFVGEYVDGAWLHAQ
jgi:hypothetical protein